MVPDKHEGLTHIGCRRCKAVHAKTRNADQPQETCYGCASNHKHELEEEVG